MEEGYYSRTIVSVHTCTILPAQYIWAAAALLCGYPLFRQNASVSDTWNVVQGVNIMQFCKEYNSQTQDKAGSIIPVEITVYEVCGCPGESLHSLVTLILHVNSATGPNTDFAILTASIDVT